MKNVSFWTRLIFLGCFVFIGCSSDSGDSTPSGQEVYNSRSLEGNTFACATCHALSEPTNDGFLRPGHPIGDATRRPSYKNGELTEMLDAVNVCRSEWMIAPEWTASSAEWLALFEYLDGQATVDVAPELSFSIVSPPADLMGGDMESGRDIFNGRCVVCHGEDATGTQRAPALVGELLTEDTIARRVRTSGRVDSQVYPGLTGGVMPFWAADRLSDNQLIDVIAFVRANDPRTGNGGNGGGTLRQCDSTHSKIGQTATLQPFAHGVGGTATIIDDCTVEITNFDYDGQGIDVRFYSGLGGNYASGFSMSENDLRRDSGYSNETVYAQLPVGNTLDELDGISVWCVPASASFGDGLFQ